MSSPRTFRFGVIHRTAPSRAEWQERARRAEDLGYDTFLVSDHFLEHFAMGPALTSAAEAASRIRVGSMVYDSDFRHPVVLAKEAASIDLLTDGRFELGLGAGWMLSDYEQSGISFDPPPVRFQRFAETLEVLKGLFAEGPFTFRGRYFTIEGLEGLPKPKQRPRMPIVVGAGGPRMLRLAAREADVISILVQSLPAGGLSFAEVTSASFDDKLRLIRETAGERYAKLEISLLMQQTAVTDDRQRAADEIGRMWNTPPEAVLDCPLAVIGSVDHIVDELQARRDRWDASYVCVFAQAMETFAPVVSRLAGR
ncbi:MAG TPA: TIGR03621 family F420-dependent LLM class oxidoreductase [Chloroflexota bacterium]